MNISAYYKGQSSDRFYHYDTDYRLYITLYGNIQTTDKTKQYICLPESLNVEAKEQRDHYMICA